MILKKMGAVPNGRVNVELNFFSRKQPERGIQMSVCLFIKPALMLLSFPLVSEPEASLCLSLTVPMWQPELSFPHGCFDLQRISPLSGTTGMKSFEMHHERHKLSCLPATCRYLQSEA